MNIGNLYQCLRVFFLAVLVAVLTFGDFGVSQFNTSAQAYSICYSDEVDITGDYACTPKCIIREDGNLNYQGNLGGEIDTVEHYPEADTSFYKVTIKSNDGTFEETEIGPRVHSQLWTATSDVSDGNYPVLEDYFFYCNSSPYNRTLSVRNFTKIVRNPSQGNFKSCIVDCVKN